MATVTGQEATNFDMSPDSGINDLQNLSPEEQEKQKAEWTEELAKIEEEINTLKHVLASKTKAAQDLRRKLGISVFWKDMNDDLVETIKNVKDSTVYQKTESLVKPVAERATNILGGFSSGITTKIGQIKQSESFRSFEEKVGSAYENVKIYMDHVNLEKTKTGPFSMGKACFNKLPAGIKTLAYQSPNIFVTKLREYLVLKSLYSIKEYFD